MSRGDLRRACTACLNSLSSNDSASACSSAWPPLMLGLLLGLPPHVLGLPPLVLGLLPGLPPLVLGFALLSPISAKQDHRPHQPFTYVKLIKLSGWKTGDWYRWLHGSPPRRSRVLAFPAESWSNYSKTSKCMLSGSITQALVPQAKPVDQPKNTVTS